MQSEAVLGGGIGRFDWQRVFWGDISALGCVTVALEPALASPFEEEWKRAKTRRGELEGDQAGREDGEGFDRRRMEGEKGMRCT
jgi:hypothetical protein